MHEERKVMNVRIWEMITLNNNWTVSSRAYGDRMDVEVACSICGAHRMERRCSPEGYFLFGAEVATWQPCTGKHDLVWAIEHGDQPAFAEALSHMEPSLATAGAHISFRAADSLEMGHPSELHVKVRLPADETDAEVDPDQLSEVLVKRLAVCWPLVSVNVTQPGRPALPSRPFREEFARALTEAVRAGDGRWIASLFGLWRSARWPALRSQPARVATSLDGAGLSLEVEGLSGAEAPDPEAVAREASRAFAWLLGSTVEVVVRNDKGAGAWIAGPGAKRNASREDVARWN
jgi:hypothetical protein